VIAGNSRKARLIAAAVVLVALTSGGAMAARRYLATAPASAPAMGTLAVHTNPAGATVVIDGQQLPGLTPLGAIGVNLKEHDIRFEEDNWESPTLGAWGIGWQVLLDGLEITQFTYFQQSGGIDLDPISVELTYGLERICAFLQDAESVYDLRWSADKTYGDIRLTEEQQLSEYSFDRSDAAAIRAEFELHEKQAKEILDGFKTAEGKDRMRWPLLAAYDHCLKCSHLFNLMDARGVISTTERAALMARVRTLACRTAAGYLEQRSGAAPRREVRA